MPELDSEAVAFQVASELFAEVRRLRREDLRTLRLMTEYQGRQVPTVAGVILFGVDRLGKFPDAWIQAGRFEGGDRRRILDTSELRSYPPTAIEEAIRFVQRNTARELVIEGARRVDRWTYPPVAVREDIVNAVVNADYAQRGAPIRVSIFDDRMEIENPGLLPFGLTVEEIRGGVSKLRNRVIGRVTLHAERRRPPRVDAKDDLIIQTLRSGKGLSTSEIAGRVKLSTRATWTRLQSLIERGLVVSVGAGPNDPRRAYCLVEV